MRPAANASAYGLLVLFLLFSPLDSLPLPRAPRCKAARSPLAPRSQVLTFLLLLRVFLRVSASGSSPQAPHTSSQVSHHGPPVALNSALNGCLPLSRSPGRSTLAPARAPPPAPCSSRSALLPSCRWLPECAPG